MDLVNITKELYEGSKRLEKSSGEIFLLAKGAAETERTYRVALAKEKMELREEGMSVGLIDDVARGNIADKRFERDLANLKYVAGRDSMKAIIAQLNALQSILRITKEV